MGGLDDGLVELKDADGVGSGDRHAKSPEKMMDIILGEFIQTHWGRLGCLLPKALLL